MKPVYRIALIIVFFLALAGILAGIYLFELQHKDLSKVKPDFKMSAEELYKAFETDEALASSKYVEKVIEVSGTIESIKPGEENSVNVSLKTGSAMGSVICTFQKLPSGNQLKEGQNAVIRGECSGYLTDVLLNDCSAVEVRSAAH
ncbi:MAG: hypothetical protein Q8868_05745 [Bacteroidota bacterium]|nr:hypothetical protein [Bacteroidota bacterium]